MSGVIRGLSGYEFGGEAPKLIPTYAPENLPYNPTDLGLIARPHPAYIFASAAAMEEPGMLYRRGTAYCSTSESAAYNLHMLTGGFGQRPLVSRNATQNAVHWMF
jgi:hypothetical protein